MKSRSSKKEVGQYLAEEEQKVEFKKISLIAQKDFEIVHNEYHRKIKAGEDVSDVPEKYLENLRTEKVII